MWPAHINTSDGYEVPSQNKDLPGNSPNGQPKYIFPELTLAWNDVEDKIDTSKDYSGDMMVWSMYQIFHSESLRTKETGAKGFRPSEVSQKIIEERFRENLNTQGWEFLKKEYEGY